MMSKFFHLNTHALTLSLMLFFNVISQQASAHHSTSHFSEDISEMEGTIVKVNWRNPHVYLYIETEEENGQKKEWELEAGTLYMIQRAGITSDLFKVGDKIKVAGNKSNSYDDKFWLENVLTANGEEYILVARSAPRWTDEAVGGRQQWNNTETGNKITSDVGNGIFRVWSPSTRGVKLSAGAEANRLANVATEAALAGRGNWDYSFDQDCRVPGMPRANHSPHPHQFIDMGDSIHIYSEEFHQTRVIHMNSKDEDADNQPYSLLGYSIGSWEDDNTLTIKTSRIDFPYMDLTGILQSKEVTVEERYVLSQDQSQLEYTVIVNDPEMLKEAHIKRGVWLDLNEVIDKSTVCVPQQVAEN